MLSAQYEIQYQTDNPVVDGQTRTVEVTITATDPQGTPLQETKTAYYTAVPPLSIELTSETEALVSRGQDEQSPIKIVAEFVSQDGNSPITATLFYKHKDAQEFSNVPMTNIGNNIYEATIPAEKVLSPFVSYYIEVQSAERKTTLPSTDPATQAFVIAVLPNVLPVITHNPLTEVDKGQDIVISAAVTDTTNQVSKVTLHYRKKGRVDYVLSFHEFNQTDVQFTATIPGDVVTENGIQYYLSAEDDFGSISTFGTADEPIEPFVRNVLVCTVGCIEGKPCLCFDR
ncbi:MAG: hypothetical protein ABFS56_19165 [Pseudomonadota bacterium]